jgi:hypothetical protein
MAALDRGEPMKNELTTAPLSWCEALEAEFRALYGVTALESQTPGDPDERLRAHYARIHARAPSAVCLSGGGIRSSTFALGVLQGLAHIGVLKHIDYLSTVSGGGYTGGWLTTWLHREGPQGRDGVMRELDPDTAAQIGSIDLESPVDRLRNTCRYLAPRGGLVSADVWTLAMTMGRNLILNWLVILPLLAAALLIPRVYYAIIHSVEQRTTFTGICGFAQLAGAPLWFLSVAAIGWVTSSAYLVLNFVGYGGQWSQGRFLNFFVMPVLISAVSITLFWSAVPCQVDSAAGGTIFLAGTIPTAGWLVVGGARHGIRGVAITLGALVFGLMMLWTITGWLFTKQYIPTVDVRDLYRALGTIVLMLVMAPVAQRLGHPDAVNDGSTLRIRVGARTVGAAFIASSFLGAGMYWFGYHFGFGQAGLRESYAAFAVPTIALFGLLNIVIFIGIASREIDDSALEWWSRAGAWLAIVTLLWAAASVLVFYVADIIESGLRSVSAYLTVDHMTSTAALAVLVPLLSSLAGMAVRGVRPGQTSGLKMAVQSAALPLVIFMLLASVAWADLRIIEQIEYHRGAGGIKCTPEIAALEPIDGPCHPNGAGLGEVLWLFGGLLGFGLVVSRLVPANRFSLHGMYRQRLIRTFLGASRRDRRPNAFTGFDSKDDVYVHQLADVRPLHVINTTLNAVQSTHVGRHETKAQSMTFSPLHVGNRFVGYRPAPEYGSDGHGRSTGISLGMALAVSGAAASSAMGIYSTKARAFLLTLANARLGLWFGNPQSAKTWRRSEPPLGVEPLVREMLGLTTDHNPYVYLSDGGHYENLALWEMVARRCRYIIISDAGCDPAYSYGDLSNAVRRIRLDLGIPIHFPPLSLSPTPTGGTNRHGAIGVIKYSAVDGSGAPDGTLLYLKATLSGDESVDVRNFAAGDPLFPHDSTSNQFFDEARFESYRALGFHTVLSVTGGVQGIDGAAAMCRIAKEVLDGIEPPNVEPHPPIIAVVPAA